MVDPLGGGGGGGGGGGSGGGGGGGGGGSAVLCEMLGTNSVVVSRSGAERPGVELLRGTSVLLHFGDAFTLDQRDTEDASCRAPVGSSATPRALLGRHFARGPCVAPLDEEPRLG